MSIIKLLILKMEFQLCMLDTSNRVYILCIYKKKNFRCRYLIKRRFSRVRQILVGISSSGVKVCSLSVN